MIDLAVFLLMVLAAAAVLLKLWSLVIGRSRSRGRWLLRGAVCVVLAGVPLAYVLWRVSAARRLQLMGELVTRVETTDSIVALTFDDGPVPAATRQVLETLRSRGVRATFFLTGAEMEQNPEAARLIVQAGHEVGNHSWSHPRMIGLSLDSIAREIEATDRQIRRAGQIGEIHFRSPFGKKLFALPYYLWRTGRTNVSWDVEPDSDPAIGASAERVAAHALERTRPGSIILLHVMYASRAESLKAVPLVIDGLHRRGYRFVTVSEALRRR